MDKTCLLFICILKVYISTAHNVETTTENVNLRVWSIGELKEIHGAFSNRVPPLTLGNQRLGKQRMECFAYHQMCLYEKNQTYNGSVCSYHKNFGLINFLFDCDIHLENCLVEVHERKLGIMGTTDAFFYNQQGKNCSYYTDQAFTIADAMKLYILHGSIRRHLKIRL